MGVVTIANPDVLEALGTLAAYGLLIVVASTGLFLILEATGVFDNDDYDHEEEGSASP